MGKILITTIGSRGHVNPLLALAERLVALGHEVLWLPRRIPGFVPVVPHVRGVRIHHLDWDWLPPGESLDFAGAARDFGKYVDNNIAWRLRCIEALLPRLKAAFAELAPDLLIIDGQMWPAVIAAEHLGLRYVCAFTSPAFMLPPGFDCELTRTLTLLEEPRREHFLRHGVPPCFAVWEYVSPTLNLAFALPELVGNHRPLPPHTELVGPTVQLDRPDDPTDFPWQRLQDGAPIVYVSFGTVWYAQPDLFATIARAAVSLGLQVVLTAGELMDTPFPATLPPGVVAARVNPQLAILKRAAICVSHGGANTVMEAAYYGVPQLIVPLCTDQPVNAFFVENSGVGLSLHKDRLTEAQCRSALQQLLDAASRHAAACQRVRAAYRRQDGVARSAERITALLP
jgi:MGT family glycosyltransferase